MGSLDHRRAIGGLQEGERDWWPTAHAIRLTRPALLQDGLGTRPIQPFGPSMDRIQSLPPRHNAGTARKTGSRTQGMPIPTRRDERGPSWYCYGKCQQRQSQMAVWMRGRRQP